MIDLQTRIKLSLLIEIAMMGIAIGWILYLAVDIKNTGSPRSIFELALIGALVWWPVFRIRIQRGYWLRDFNDIRSIDLQKDPPPCRRVSARSIDARSD